MENLRNTWAPGTITEPKPKKPETQELRERIFDEALRPVTIDDLHAADAAVAQARTDLQQAGINVQTARGALAAALTKWNAGAPAMTALEAARQFQAQSQAERARRAEAGLYRRPATVSETAKAYAGGGHGVMRGGGRSYAGRNPFGSAQPLTKTQAMEANARRIRAEKAAAAAAGLPEHE